MRNDERHFLTIGHSNHSLEWFVQHLTEHRVTTVVDVRTVPVSQFAPHFIGAQLRASLRRADIEYVFAGDGLGGRPSDASCYVDGRVDYGRVAATPVFRRAIDHLIELDTGGRPVLMCSEKDPLTCHRTFLVAQELVALGHRVEHIGQYSGSDGRPIAVPESHREALDRLAREEFPQPSLLVIDEEEERRQAIGRRSAAVAYSVRAAQRGTD